MHLHHNALAKDSVSEQKRSHYDEIVADIKNVLQGRPSGQYPISLVAGFMRRLGARLQY